MSAESFVVLAICVLLMVYLFYALLKAERF